PTHLANDSRTILIAVGTPSADLLERMWDPTVHIDGRLATVWTPYDFYRDGEFSHCGVDVFVIARTGDGWKIVSLVDTRRRAGCEGWLNE
ncbi:MAG: hypothetical protein ACE5FP_06550, partial [Gemmatimonadota bacterium]